MMYVRGFFVTLLLLVWGFAFAQRDSYLLEHPALPVYEGPTQLIDQELSTISIAGPVFVDHSWISQRATIKGSLEARLSTFNRLDVEGTTRFEHVTVTELFVNGPLYALYSDIRAASVAAHDILLSGTRVGRLWVRRIPGDPSQQRVYLQRDSQVEWIIFESKNGRIILADSTVIVDHIDGGQVELRDSHHY